MSISGSKRTTERETAKELNEARLCLGFWGPGFVILRWVFPGVELVRIEQNSGAKGPVK